MRHRRVFVVGLLCIAALNPIPAPALDCQPVTRAGVGDVCQLPNGLLRLPNGNLTHGPDTAAGTNTTDEWVVSSLRPPVCVAATDKHVELIYARAYDDQNRYDDTVPAIRYYFEGANGLLHDTAVATGAGSADYKTICTNGVPTVHHAVLPTSVTNDSFSSVINDIRAAGYTSSKAKYVVVYDETINGFAGMAEIVYDDRLAADNGSLAGNMIAVVVSLNSQWVMHELSHTMGAVQHSAPHSTGAGHCTDGYDVMCRADGGPNSGNYNTNACPTVREFDCDNDDYFNTHPAAGSYLATRWNLGSSFNTWLQINYTPPPPPPPPTDPTPPTLTVTHPRTSTAYDAVYPLAACDVLHRPGFANPIFHEKWVCLAWTASDAGGLDRLEVWVDGVLRETIRQNLTGSVPTTPGACCYAAQTVRQIKNNVPLELRLYDTAGNRAIWSRLVDLASGI